MQFDSTSMKSLALVCSLPLDDFFLTLRFARKKGFTEIAKLLLADPRVDPSANNLLSLELASSNGDAEVVKLLLVDQRIQLPESAIVSNGFSSHGTSTIVSSRTD
jgi:hypothetical protein